jgi:hypothetical protein
MRTAQDLRDEDRDEDPLVLLPEEEQALGTKVIYTAWAAVVVGFLLPPVALMLRMGTDVRQQWRAVLRVSISNGAPFTIYALLLLAFIAISIRNGRVVVRQRYERMATSGVLMALLSGIFYTFPDKPLTVVGPGVSGYLFVGFVMGYFTLLALQTMLWEE